MNNRFCGAGCALRTNSELLTGQPVRSSWNAGAVPAKPATKTSQTALFLVPRAMKDSKRGLIIIRVWLYDEPANLIRILQSLSTSKLAKIRPVYKIRYIGKNQVCGPSGKWTGSNRRRSRFWWKENHKKLWNGGEIPGKSKLQDFQIDNVGPSNST